MGVTIAFKLFPAMAASECVVRFALHSFGMCIPPRHSTGIGAEQLFPFMRCLLKRCPAVPTQRTRFRYYLVPHGMSDAKGLYGVQRQSRQRGYFLVSAALALEFYDSAAFRFCHIDASFLRKSVSRYTQRKSTFVRVKWAKNNALHGMIRRGHRIQKTFFFEG